MYRSDQNQMIPLSNLVKITPITGAQAITHFNLFRSIELNGAQAEGIALDGNQNNGAASSRGSATEYGLWSGLSLDEQESGGTAPIIFGLGIVFVFLVLAAYENYVDPIILLTVPLAIFGALLAQSMRGIPTMFMVRLV